MVNLQLCLLVLFCIKPHRHNVLLWYYMVKYYYIYILCGQIESTLCHGSYATCDLKCLCGIYALKLQLKLIFILQTFVVCCFMENACCFMSYPSMIHLLVLFLKIKFLCAVIGFVEVFALSFPNFSYRNFSNSWREDIFKLCVMQ